MSPSQQRQLDHLAAGLMLSGTLSGFIAGYFLKQGVWSPRLSTPNLVALAIVQPLMLGWMYYIGKGRRWAKILYLVLTGLGWIFLAFRYQRLQATTLTSLAATASFSVQQVLSLTIAVLLCLTLRKPTPELAQVAEPDVY